jgi:hypothetical protein
MRDGISRSGLKLNQIALTNNFSPPFSGIYRLCIKDSDDNLLEMQAKILQNEIISFPISWKIISIHMVM